MKELRRLPKAAALAAVLTLSCGFSAEAELPVCGPNSEDGFRSAIAEAPNDWTTKLVFADWLEERGDARGEYIRLSHQLAGITGGLAAWWPIEARRGAALQRWLESVAGSEWQHVEPIFVGGVPFDFAFKTPRQALQYLFGRKERAPNVERKARDAIGRRRVTGLLSTDFRRFLAGRATGGIVRDLAEGIELNYFESEFFPGTRRERRRAVSTRIVTGLTHTGGNVHDIASLAEALLHARTPLVEESIIEALAWIGVGEGELARGARRRLAEVYRDYRPRVDRILFQLEDVFDREDLLRLRRFLRRNS